MTPAASTPTAEAEALMHELSHDLMSPYCPGRTIASCPSGAARKLEDNILEEAESGKTREEIEAQLVDRFGPQVVGYAGRPIVLWGSAVVAILAAVIIAWMGRRWVISASRRRPVPAATAAPARAPAASELDRLEDELDEIDEF